MGFNWEKFIEDYGIEEAPSNHHHRTDSFKFQVHCPLGDHNFHLGLGPVSNSCFIHGGSHNLSELITSFTNCSSSDVSKIIKKYSEKDWDFDFKELHKRSDVKQIFYPYFDLTDRAKQYLIDRGFSPSHLIYKYNISYQPNFGKFAGRIIIPFYEDGRLVSYCGRRIDSGNPKYRNLEDGDSVIPIKNCLYGLDFCEKDYVVVVEGVTDVWKMGDNFVALSGNSLSEEQKIKLVKRFKTIIVMLDAGFVDEGLKIVKKISPYRRCINFMISGGDPGDFSDKEISETRELIKSLV